MTELFPFPARLTATFSLPGYDADSTLALQEILKDNHTRHHGYFNRTLKFQNHITHHVLAIWAFGARRKVLKAAYAHELHEQEPAFDSPSPITPSNYHEHLGDDNYFKAYVNFFSSQLEEKDTAQVLEEFIFSSSTNNTSKTNAISRFMDNLVHPMIHIGYGLEFGLPGLVVEGLALAATLSGKRVEPLFPSTQPASYTGTVLRGIGSLIFSASGPQTTKRVHAFDVLARIIEDTAFDGPLNPETSLEDTISAHATTLVAYAREWASGSWTTTQRVEQLQWTCSLIYAVTGVNKAPAGQTIHADFFLMHLVTSSLFLPSYIPYLSAASQTIFLQSYMTAVLTWWISRGRRALDIESFYSTTTTTPTLPSSTTTPPPWALSQDSDNPWFAIMQHAIFHPDDHLCKIQRAFARYAEAYGDWGKGHFADTKLKGAELLDGTLFVRAAGLTAQRTSRASDEGKSFVWDVSWVA